MSKNTIVNSIILGGSLMISIALISVASLNASTVGNNSGVWKPINEGDQAQVKQSNFTSLGIVTGNSLYSTSGVSAQYFSDIDSINSEGNATYYLNPSSSSNLNELVINGNSKLERDNSQINNTGEASLVNKRYVDSSIANSKKQFDVIPKGFNFFGNDVEKLIARGGITQSTGYSYPEYICSLSGYSESEVDYESSTTCGLYIDGGVWKMRSTNSGARTNGCMYMCFKIQ